MSEERKIFAAVYTDEGPLGVCIDPYYTDMRLRVLLFLTMEAARTAILNNFSPVGRKNPMWRLVTPFGGDGFGDLTVNPDVRIETSVF